MLDEKRTVRMSRFLSMVLRHQPDKIGITLDEGGWADVDELMAACGRAGRRLTRADLDHVVATNDKKRFAFSEDGRRIRASQGHSVEVDLGLVPAEPPGVLYHGTAAATLPLILREGLRPMSRQDVHLSADAETAVRVGSRHGRPVVLEVDAAGLVAAGHVFRVSANGVWLTDGVPPGWLRTLPR
ncbi:RNA 2'-phosphotransferase [Actinacidiphila acidipaludis]|uniref:Probable RNA 2'-phosphotransferase n=1 Tax=Actinacidiphila acidipaludis TaxID=2873382 RepID=A0ABS7QB11_9ACTN|nr:RNA 2'-phosphotransferase [Streptomyces acidipaludis]MBY8880370.1 RNA 2'-phosphotransferase [Streptomyces acidipaludis]